MKTFAWLLLAALAIAHQSAPGAAAAVDCENRSTCSENDPQVCGSDGVTYTNQCTFEFAYCSEPSDDLFVVSEGPCKKKVAATPAPTTTASTSDAAPDTTPAPTEGDSGTQPSTAAGSASFSTEEPSESPPAAAPVEQPLAPVPAPAQAPTPAPATGGSGSGSPSDTNNMNCQIKCPNDWNPVCGSDDETYANECHRLAAKCRDPSLLTVHLGECVRTPAPASSYSSSSGSYSSSPGSYSSSSGSYSSSSSSTSGSGWTPSPTPASTKTVEVTVTGSVRPKCNPICSKVYEPVCGSNSVTYANQCLLDFAACKDPRVMKAGEGKCPKRPKNKPCVPEICTSVEDPVCASDGETYINECMFNNARCSAPQLVILHDGECNEETPLKCATMTCPKFTECREDEDSEIAYCADVCASERCGEGEECQLLDAECFTAPCSPVATCVAIEDDVEAES